MNSEMVTHKSCKLFPRESHNFHPEIWICSPVLSAPPPKMKMQSLSACLPELFYCSIKFLDSIGMKHLLLDLLLVPRYTAGEAAVTYNVSESVDVLVNENRIRMIETAFMSGVFLLMLNQMTDTNENDKKNNRVIDEYIGE